MANNDAGLSDAVHTQLGPDAEGQEPGGDRPQADSIPDRPADGAGKADWVDYTVALGADRTFVTGDTEHFDVDSGEMVTLPALTKKDLIELADRLGG